jgi:hypothetical protein
MYPPFIDQAAQEKSSRAVKSFRMANEVKKIHHNLYQQALAAMEAGGRLAEGSYYVCPICGKHRFWRGTRGLPYLRSARFFVEQDRVSSPDDRSEEKALSKPLDSHMPRIISQFAPDASVMPGGRPCVSFARCFPLASLSTSASTKFTPSVSRSAKAMKGKIIS